MKRSLVKIVFVLALAVSAVGCQKELSIDTLGQPPGGGGSGGGGTAASLIGKWTLLDMKVKTVADIRMTDGVDAERAVTISEYTTANNKGTLTFTSTQMINENIGYDINGTARGYFYTNGVLSDSAEFPFTFSIPSSSGQSDYKTVGTDSIWFENSFVSIPNSGTSSSSNGGGKYKIESDILTLDVGQTNSTSETTGGVTTVNNMSVSTVMRLKKQ